MFSQPVEEVKLHSSTAGASGAEQAKGRKRSGTTPMKLQENWLRTPQERDMRHT